MYVLIHAHEREFSRYIFLYVCMYVCMYVRMTLRTYDSLSLGKLQVGTDGGDTALDHRLQTVQHLRLEKLRVRANLV